MYCTVILLRAKALAGVCLTDWVVLSSKFAWHITSNIILQTK
jgi:hypothetical protein